MFWSLSLHHQSVCPWNRSGAGPIQQETHIRGFHGVESMEIISKVNKKRSRRDSCRRSRLRQGIAPTNNNKPRSVNRAGFRVLTLTNTLDIHWIFHTFIWVIRSMTQVVKVPFDALCEDVYANIPPAKVRPLVPLSGMSNAPTLASAGPFPRHYTLCAQQDNVL